MYLASGPSGMKATKNRNRDVVEVSPMSIAQFYHCKIAFSPLAVFDFLSVSEGQTNQTKSFITSRLFCISELKPRNSQKVNSFLVSSQKSDAAKNLPYPGKKKKKLKKCKYQGSQPTLNPKHQLTPAGVWKTPQSFSSLNKTQMKRELIHHFTPLS